MASERVIGIDLGTTNSVVGIVDGPKPRIVLAGDSRPQMRSVVSLMEADGAEAEVVVGNVAYDNWPMAPKDTIVSIKRLMGRGIADKEVERVRAKYLYDIVEPRDGTRDSVRVVMGGRPYSPSQISAIILRKLKEDCEFRLGEPISGAVITVPAYFSQAQKIATRQAALDAGLVVMKILDEPTAAAIAYGMEAGKKDAKTILVYDLGGGTFDVSVLLWAGQTFAPLALQGDMWLGGDDFDQVLVDHALKFLKEEKKVDPTTNMQYMVALKSAAQKAKEALSSSTTARLIVNGAGILTDRDGSPVNLNMPLTRQMYEEMIAPLVAKASALVAKALEEAGYTPQQISSVLMAGNSSMIPAVQRSMEGMFGRDKIVIDLQPKECVALGAAIQAARMRGFFSCPFPDSNNPERTCDTWNEKDATKCKVCGGVFAVLIPPTTDSDPVEPMPDLVTTIAPFHYGVQSAGDKFDIYVEKGEVCPTQEVKTKIFFTQKANQRMLYIPVYAGENREKASSNKKEGEAFAILPPGLTQGSRILIRLWLDEEGLFKLDAQVKDGPDLKPWMMYGEADAKSVQKIIEGDQIVEGNASIASAEDIEKAEQHKTAAFDAMQDGNLKKAIDETDAYIEMAQGLGGEGPFDKVKALVNFTDFLLHEFGWALPAALAYNITSLRGELEELDGRGLSALEKKERKAKELEEELNRLPELVNVLLRMRGAIREHVTPKDPVAAMGLEEDFDKVVEIYKKRDPSGQLQLAEFAKKLTDVIERLIDKCAVCGNKKPPRICPNCGNDILLPKSSAIGVRAGSGQFGRGSVRGLTG